MRNTFCGVCAAAQPEGVLRWRGHESVRARGTATKRVPGAVARARVPTLSRLSIVVTFGKIHYTPLDKNRQTTTANDCNQVAQELDIRLKALQATSIYDLGLSDERTGMTEVEPWILGLLKLLESS